MNLTCTETIGMFRPTPRYQVSLSLPLCYLRFAELEETFTEFYQGDPRTRIRSKKSHEPIRKLVCRPRGPREAASGSYAAESSQHGEHWRFICPFKEILVRQCADNYVDHKFYSHPTYL